MYVADITTVNDFGWVRLYVRLYVFVCYGRKACTVQSISELCHMKFAIPGKVTLGEQVCGEDLQKARSKHAGV